MLDTAGDLLGMFDAVTLVHEFLELAIVRIHMVDACYGIPEIVRLLAHGRLLRLQPAQPLAHTAVFLIGLVERFTGLVIAGIGIDEFTLSGNRGDAQLIGLPMNGDQVRRHFAE